LADFTLYLAYLILIVVIQGTSIKLRSRSLFGAVKAHFLNGQLLNF